MKTFKQHILEKLKVSKNSISDITLESLANALKDYKERKHFVIAYFDLKEILEEYPVVLQYNGTYTNKNIIGEKIRAIGYYITAKDAENLVFIDFDRRIGDSKSSINSIRILNTDDLYDIFGEEAVNKIYDYIIKQ